MDVIDIDQCARLWRVRGSAQAMEDALIGASQDRLEQIAGLFSHVVPEIEVRSGPDFVEVINQVFEGGHDIVVVGSSARASSSARLDPAITHLLRKCPAPVRVGDESHQDGDVMVALGPEYDDDSASFNRTLLELGSSFAHRKGVGLHVAHSWRVMGESLMFGGRVSMPREEADALLEEARKQGDMLIRSTVEQVPLAADAELHLLHRRPEKKLVEIVADLRPGLVVMGTVARRGIGGVIIGNTAERVLLTIDASIMAVKPSGSRVRCPGRSGRGREVSEASIYDTDDTTCLAVISGV